MNEIQTQVECFCKYCGAELGEHPIKRWDEFTGKQFTASHCTNLKCEKGCGYAGHQWGNFWLMRHDHCERCGYVFGDYGY